ncbi:MAG: TetR family transcriptional regulator [Hyphomicrobiales bacterium]|nr:TetR family transcriptional regulator [Hyphomicrobiales bacterium]
MVRVTKAEAAAHRAAIVRAAGRLFRARGIAAVGVADVTRAAGLTHGGFYGHFTSKEALAAEAIAEAFAEGRRRLGGRGVEGYVRGYVSRAHRDHPEDGCPLLAFSGSAARGDEVETALADGAEALIEALAELLEARADETAEQRRDRAAALLAAAIGGQVLARALVRTDREFSDRVLAQTRILALDLAGDDATRAEIEGSAKG